MSEKFLELIESNSTLIIPYGENGSGKSTFLMLLFRFFYSNYQISLNFDHNPTGIAYFQYLLDNYKAGQFPVATSPEAPNEIDLLVINNNNERLFTFVDYPAEVTDRESIRSKYERKIGDYLNVGALRKIVLIFYDCSEPEGQDLRLLDFLTKLLPSIGAKSMEVGMILTKWDLVSNGETRVDEYLQYNAPQLFIWLNNYNLNKNEPIRIFPFSIGSFKYRDDGHVEFAYDVTDGYCRPIADWLLDTHKNQKLLTRLINKIKVFLNLK